MKTKLSLILFAALFCAGVARAATDRFGSERDEIARSSFTDGTPETNVIISSVPADGQGSLVVRSIIFSGMASSTVTFYDANIFTPATSTMTKVIYAPNIGLTGGSGSIPSQVYLDLYISSAIMYHKIGAAAVTIKWDWLAPRKQGDARP